LSSNASICALRLLMVSVFNENFPVLLSLIVLSGQTTNGNFQMQTVEFLSDLSLKVSTFPLSPFPSPFFFGVQLRDFPRTRFDRSHGEP